MLNAICQIVTSSEFWAAIVGALVGGLIALLAQLLALRAQRKQREEDRLRTSQALATSLLFKMRDMHGNYVQARRSVEEQFAEAKKEGMEGEPWRFFKPSASSLSHFHFTPDEKATLLELKNDKLLNDTLLLEPRHYHFVESLSTLNKLILELLEKIVPVQIEGDRGRIELTGDEYAKVRPRMIQVNELIEVLRAEASEDSEEYGKLLENLAAEYKAKLRLPFTITAPPAGDQGEQERSPAAPAGPGPGPRTP